jgi:hypothetical protein
MTSIKSFPRYTINEKSEVYDTLKERIIKQCNHSEGYKCVHLVDENGNDKKRLIHRLIFENFILKNGDTMPKEIDHIDNNRSNNQIANLRAATRQENSRNKPKRKDNSSGYKNIIITKWETYRVQICISKDVRYIKTFKILQDAIDYSIRIMDEYHGDFARH